MERKILLYIQRALPCNSILICWSFEGVAALTFFQISEIHFTIVYGGTEFIWLTLIIFTWTWRIKMIHLKPFTILILQLLPLLLIAWLNLSRYSLLVYLQYLVFKSSLSIDRVCICFLSTLYDLIFKVILLSFALDFGKQYFVVMMRKVIGLHNLWILKPSKVSLLFQCKSILL